MCRPFLKWRELHAFCVILTHQPPSGKWDAGCVDFADSIPSLIRHKKSRQLALPAFETRDEKSGFAFGHREPATEDFQTGQTEDHQKRRHGVIRNSVRLRCQRVTEGKAANSKVAVRINANVERTGCQIRI